MNWMEVLTANTVLLDLVSTSCVFELETRRKFSSGKVQFLCAESV